MIGIDSTFTHPDGAVFHVTTFGDRSGAGGSPLEQAAGPGTEDNVIVLIQGHGATKTSYGAPGGLAERFAAKGYFVITFDNRGVGCTRVPGQESFVVADGVGRDVTAMEQDGEALFTYSDMADDVVALMDHFVVAKAHVAGGSMGGQITTLVGVRHPARCLSLTVIMSASPLQGTVAIATARNPQWFAAISTVPQNQPGDSLEQVLANVDSHHFTGPMGGTETFADEVDVQRRLENATIDYHRGAIDFAPNVGSALQGLAGSAWAASEEGQNIKDSLRSLTVPAIWIGGTTDPIVSIEEQRKTAALVPGARMYEFDCGHEIPERTLEGTASIMLSHMAGAVEPRNRQFRASAQDLSSSLSNLGPRL